MRVEVLLLLAACRAAPAPTPDPDPHCNHGHSGPSPTPPTHPLPRVRPPKANRSFVSPAVERALAALVDNRTWRDPELATLFYNCLPNTLDTTVWQAPNGSDPRGAAAPHAGGDASFVSTGDQASMYLRDSQNQVLPYVRFAAQEPEGIGAFLRGILRRYVDSVALDPYANSFDFTAADRRCNPGAWTKDNTTTRDPATGARVDGMKPGIHQRKWEMDSLASVLKLSRLYHAATADARPFDGRWRAAVGAIIDTFRAMQAPLSPRNFTSVNYTFQTLTYEPKDTSAHGIGRNHRTCNHRARAARACCALLTAAAAAAAACAVAATADHMGCICICIRTPATATPPHHPLAASSLAACTPRHAGPLTPSHSLSSALAHGAWCMVHGLPQAGRA